MAKDFQKKCLESFKRFTIYSMNCTYDGFFKKHRFLLKLNRYITTHLVSKTKTDRNMVEKIYNHLRRFIQYYRHGDNRR